MQDNTQVKEQWEAKEMCNGLTILIAKDHTAFDDLIRGINKLQGTQYPTIAELKSTAATAKK